MEEYKVIFHIDEISKWELLLGNVTNLLAAAEGIKIEIEVLANAQAVKYYDPSQQLNPDIETMKILHQKGVRFVACNKALNANNVNKDNLLEFTEVVPAGIFELIQKQNEGYVYIKP